MIRMRLLSAAFLLAMLAACGVSQDNRDSAGQEETENPIQDAGAEEQKEESSEDTGNNATAERIYETESILYSEPVGGLSFRKSLQKTQTDYAVYYFEPSVSPQERNACIAATDRMLSAISAALPELEIVVLEPNDSYGISVSKNRLVLTVQPWDSVDYFAKVLLAGYSEWGNYGLAYGYADYLCRRAGLADADSRETYGFLSMSVPEAYDLNLLCFDDKFVPSGDVEAAKNNACLFVKEYLSSHSQEEFLKLLAASGTVEGVGQAKEALTAFYAENGVDCSLTEIRYQYGGLSFDYGAACKYAHFYIEEDWQDSTWKKNPLVSENFLHENYGDARKFFECTAYQMQQYQELFGFDSYNNDLAVVFLNGKGISNVSFYLGDSHTIGLIHVASLMHEYIHSLIFGHSNHSILWKSEGTIVYFSYKYNSYAYDFLNDFWNDSSAAWIQEYVTQIGRPIDMRIDFRQINDMEVYDTGFTNPNSSAAAASSFIGYLANQYGEQAVIAYVCSDQDYNEEWGKSYDELVQDWNRYLEENYAQYER